MRIDYIELQDIKCHREKRVDFHPGVNFIAGRNGAGKTTLFEAVGSALFGYNVKNLVRKGAAHGVITVGFTGADERAYAVRQRVRERGGSLVVFDGESGAELNYHTEAEIRPFVASVLGLAPGRSAQALFEHIVGVRQGAFVTPFLESPQRRRDGFDPLFGFDKYRNAAGALKDSADEVREAIHKLEVEREGAMASARGLDEEVERAAALERQAAETEASIQALHGVIARFEAAVDAHEARRKARDDARIEAHRAESERDMAAQALSQCGARVNEALAARELAERTRAEHEQYAACEAEGETLDKRRAERDALLKRCNELEGGLNARAARGAEQRRALEENAQKAGAERVLLGGKRAALEAERQALAGLLAPLEADITRERRRQDLLDACAQPLADARAYVNVLREDALVIAQNERRCAEIDAMLEDEDTAKKKLADALEAGDALTKANAALMALLARGKQNNEDMERLEGGRCPFLDKPCPVGDEGLRGFFTDRRNELRAQYKALENECKALEARAKPLEALRRQCGQYELLRQERADKRAALDKARAGFEAAAGGADARARALCDALLNAAISAEPSPSPRADDAFDAELFLKRYMDWCDAREAGISDAARAFRGRADTLKAEHARLSVSKGGVEEQIRGARERLAAIEAEDAGRTLAAEGLNEEAEIIRAEQRALEALKGELAAFDGMDAAIRHNTEQLRASKAGHEAFLKADAQAQGLEALISQREALEAEAARKKSALEVAQAALMTADEAYDERAADTSRADLSAGQARRAALEATRGHIAELAERCTQAIAEKSAARRRAETLSADIAVKTRVHAAVGGIRDIMNKAGKEIAELFLDDVSREATRIYAQVSGSAPALVWGPDYMVYLVDSEGGRRRERLLTQLSGGEQMTCALAVRLALLKRLSPLGIGFFDEPTAHLDAEHRQNLARALEIASAGMEQLFVISHDDAFDAVSNEVIFIG